MTTEQTKKLDALLAACATKKRDRSPVIDDDSHREFFQKLHEDDRRYPGGITLGESDAKRLDVWHKHYIGGA